MPYITSLEQTATKEGFQKGLIQGIQQEVRRLLIETLVVRFKTVPTDLIERISSIVDTETLETLHHYAIKCNSIEDFRESINPSIFKEN